MPSSLLLYAYVLSRYVVVQIAYDEFPPTEIMALPSCRRRSSFSVSCVLHLSPLPCLPPDLQTGRLGRFFNAEATRISNVSRLCKRFAPFVDQPHTDKQTLRYKHRAFEASKLEGGETCTPSADDLLGHLGLCDGDHGLRIESRVNLDARPHARLEVCNDAGSYFLLQLSQCLAVL
jgi:hypothetical protein